MVLETRTTILALMPTGLRALMTPPAGASSGSGAGGLQGQREKSIV